MPATPSYSASNNVRRLHFRILGTGASDPTNEFCPGAAITRNGGTGLYRITFSEDNGVLVGAQGQMMANTLAVATMRVFLFDWDSYDATAAAGSQILDFMVGDVATPAVADLAAAQRAYIEVVFKSAGA